jgi:hypothetical protein
MLREIKSVALSWLGSAKEKRGMMELTPIPSKNPPIKLSAVKISMEIV